MACFSRLTGRDKLSLLALFATDPLFLWFLRTWLSPLTPDEAGATCSKACHPPPPPPAPEGDCGPRLGCFPAAEARGSYFSSLYLRFPDCKLEMITGHA